MKEEEFEKLRGEVGTAQMALYNRLIVVEDAAEKVLTLEREIGKCQIDVYNRLHKLESSMVDVKDSLTTQSKERKEFNNTIMDEMGLLKGWFIQHGEDEMIKQDEFIRGQKDAIFAIRELAAMVESIRHNADEALDFVQLMKKYWMRITFTATGVSATLVTLYAAYAFLQKHGMVIIFNGGV